MNNVIVYGFIVYLVAVNCGAFIAYGLDKYYAVRQTWRISEKTLLIFAFLGGSLGSLIAMRFFRHKTKHFRFVVLIPVLLVIQLALGTIFYRCMTGLIY